MAPISPSSSTGSLKRPSDSQSDDERMVEHTSKRRRVEPALPRTPPPEEESFVGNAIKETLFDDDPRRLLSRSVALVLQHVGFDGATKEALEAFCAEVETCQYS
jgi:transcription initiation factor TFIID subunit 8